MDQVKPPLFKKLHPAWPGMLLGFIGLVGVGAAPLAIENENLRASWDMTTARLSLTTKPSGQVFIRDAVLSSDQPSAKVATVNHQIGRAHV